MSRSRRLTETDRLSIAKERAQGVAAADLAQRYGVSLKTIYNAVNHALDRQNANGSRPIVIGLRVSRRELAAFDAALARHGITNRTDALRHLVLAADEILEPDHPPVTSGRCRRKALPHPVRAEDHRVAEPGRGQDHQARGDSVPCGRA